MIYYGFKGYKITIERVKPKLNLFKFGDLFKSLRLNINWNFSKYIVEIMRVLSWLCNYWDDVEIHGVLIKERIIQGLN